KALEEKQRAEKEDAALSNKASAEEIAEAKEEAAKLGKVADSKRREFEAAMQKHQRAMARLAKLEGKPIHSYGLWIEDGKMHTSGDGLGYRVIGVPGEKGNKETVILRMTPDGKTERIEGHALTVPAETIGKGEHRIILSVSPDTNYEVVKKKLAELSEGKGNKEKPRFVEVVPGAGKNYEYRLITPDGKTAKPGESIQGKVYHFDAKVPEGKQGYFQIERAPDVKPGEKTFRYEIEKRFDGKADNSKTKTRDRAADLEKKIEQLQKEIQELKDALKKSGASLPGASGSVEGHRHSIGNQN
ncbi:MAG TPA: hypothetical protein VGY58_17940, partial [Gemmataceae bacterium]|nr:hypothetical protein [Gemmataceae bacterium]